MKDLEVKMNEIESEREVLEKQILNLIMKIDHKVDQIEGTWWKIQWNFLKQSRSNVDGPRIYNWTFIEVDGREQPVSPVFAILIVHFYGGEH